MSIDEIRAGHTNPAIGMQRLNIIPDDESAHPSSLPRRMDDKLGQTFFLNNELPEERYKSIKETAIKEVTPKVEELLKTAQIHKAVIDNLRKPFIKQNKELDPKIKKMIAKEEKEVKLLELKAEHLQLRAIKKAYRNSVKESKRSGDPYLDKVIEDEAIAKAAFKSSYKELHPVEDAAKKLGISSALIIPRLLALPLQLGLGFVKLIAAAGLGMHAAVDKARGKNSDKAAIALQLSSAALNDEVKGITLAIAAVADPIGKTCSLCEALITGKTTYTKRVQNDVIKVASSILLPLVVDPKASRWASNKVDDTQTAGLPEKALAASNLAANRITSGFVGKGIGKGLRKGETLSTIRREIENADCEISKLKSAKALLKNRSVNAYTLYKESENGPYKAVIFTGYDENGKQNFQYVYAASRKELNKKVYDKFEREYTSVAKVPTLIEAEFE